MSINLIDLAKMALTPDLLAKASGLLGESGDGTSKALSAALPLVVSSMATKSATSDGASGLLGLITSGKADGNMLGNLGSLLGGGQQSTDMMSMGSGLVGSLFGDKVGGIANALSSFAGIKSGSATGLLAIVAPMLMGVIGKHIGGLPGGASLANFTSLLGGQKEHVAAAMPSGFASQLGSIPGIGGLLGGLPGVGTATAAVSGLAGAATGAASSMGTAAMGGAAAATAATTAAAGGIGRIIPWLLGAAVIAGLGYYFLNRSAPAPIPAPEAAAVAEPAAASAAPAPAAPAVAAVDTCNKDFETAMAGKSINFASGKAIINADSAELVDALAKVATACASFKIEVAGHTDKTGNPASNKLLSKARAQAVANALAAKGVPAAQLTAVGFGADQPINTADTPEAYAQNRRIKFTVSQ